MGGTLARSPPWRCAAALRLSRGSCCTHTAAQGSGHKPCARAGAAQRMFYYASSFNGPLEAWDVGQVTGMQVRQRPASWSQGSCAHTAAPGCVATSRAHVLARRRGCSMRRTLSTSLWQHGTLARSPPWRCAAARRQGQGLVRTDRYSGWRALSRVRVLAWCRACSSTHALSTSRWKIGTSARSPM